MRKVEEQYVQEGKVVVLPRIKKELALMNP